MKGWASLQQYPPSLSECPGKNKNKTKKLCINTDLVDSEKNSLKSFTVPTTFSFSLFSYLIMKEHFSSCINLQQKQIHQWSVFHIRMNSFES